jgi:preprotein translocase subunit Sec63
MSKYIGKIIGVTLGLIIGKFKACPLIMIGLVIGQLFDSGFFSRKSNPSGTPSNSNELDPYAVLDVDESADMDAIDAAYRRRMSEYHPDKVANAAPEIKELAERRARDINAAYEEIRKRRQQP